jgi:hypothetical protein
MATPNDGELARADTRDELVATQHFYRGVSAAAAVAPEDSPTAIACAALLPHLAGYLTRLEAR